MTTLFKIHFEDNYGTATIECDSVEKCNEIMKNLHLDPYAENIWCEYYDDEEGWQA